MLKRSVAAADITTINWFFKQCNNDKYLQGIVLFYYWSTSFWLEMSLWNGGRLKKNPPPPSTSCFAALECFIAGAIHQQQPSVKGCHPKSPLVKIYGLFISREPMIHISKMAFDVGTILLLMTWDSFLRGWAIQTLTHFGFVLIIASPYVTRSRLVLK